MEAGYAGDGVVDAVGQDGGVVAGSVGARCIDRHVLGWRIFVQATLAELIQIMPPPSAGGDIVAWDDVFAQWGVRFPADYRGFVAVYGGGDVDDFLSISTPPVPGSGWGDVLSDVEFRNSPMPHDDCPYPSDPLNGGLLTWGQTAAGDSVFWLCRGEPDDWPTVVYRRQAGRELRWRLYDEPMASFLLALIRGERPEALSVDGFPDDPPLFRSWRAPL